MPNAEEVREATYAYRKANHPDLMLPDSQSVCLRNNIVFINAVPYSPTLTPIKQVWGVMKTSLTDEQNWKYDVATITGRLCNPFYCSEELGVHAYGRIPARAAGDISVNNSQSTLILCHDAAGTSRARRWRRWNYLDHSEYSGSSGTIIPRQRFSGLECGSVESGTLGRRKTTTMPSTTV
jgi:hypothetical protein